MSASKKFSRTLPSLSLRYFDEALQYAVVAVMTVLFLFGHTMGAILAIYLIATPFFPAVIVYLVWSYIFNFHVSSRGGRRSETFRNLKSWNFFRDYFPAKLIRTKKLDPNKNYILGYHPHGIMCAGAFVNFGTEATGFSRLFPGIKPHLLTLKIMFMLPFYRDFVMAGGMCDVSRESIEFLMRKQDKGNAAIIVVGGAAESLDARPGQYTLTLQKRVGFVKMALKTGASLVPVFSFGENELFNQVNNPRGSKLRNFQTRLQKILSFAPPLFFGRGILSNVIGFQPHKTPIFTVVGEPIKVKKAVLNPGPEQVRRLHKKYIQGLVKLFEEHKHRYGVDKSVKLIIV